MQRILDGKKLAEIGVELGVSEPRISQLKTRALDICRGKPQPTRQPPEKLSVLWPELKKLNPKHREIFKSWLLSGVSKVIANEFGTSRSMVSEIIRAGLDLIGLSCLPLNAPLLLNVQARAESEGVSMRPFPHPLMQLAFLPSAEADVARLLVDGNTPKQIGAIRGKAPRTIANQLHSVFGKFKVSGASEFKAELARRIVADWR